MFEYAELKSANIFPHFVEALTDGIRNNMHQSELDFIRIVLIDFFDVLNSLRDV